MNLKAKKKKKICPSCHLRIDNILQDGGRETEAVSQVRKDND